MRPIRDKVLIETVPDEKVSSGGIIMPDNKSKDKWRRGTVLKVGGDVREIKVGDNVIYIRFKGDEYESGKYQMVSEGDIACVYEGDVKVEEVM